ncbi:MAG: hypothetical protein ACRC5T_02505 [Cetobacterium sp.]
MKKLLLIIAITSLTACSTLDMNKQHRAEKKAVKTENRADMKVLKQQHAEVELKLVHENNLIERELKAVHTKELNKVKAKQTLEFGVLVSKKIKALKEFVK